MTLRGRGQYAQNLPVLHGIGAIPARGGARRTSKRRPPTRLRRGMTLVEVLLSLGLIIFVTAVMFIFYDVSLRSRDYGTRRIIDGNLARVVAEKIAEEVRSANGFLQGAGPGINGKERIIRIQTVVLPDKELYVRRGIQDDVPPAQSDLRQVQYYLAYDYDASFEYPDGTVGPAPLGLVRREIRTLNQVMVRDDQRESVDLDLYAPEMKYLRFRYFDGVEWLDRWDLGTGPEGEMGNSLPQAVEITVGYDAVPPPEEEEEDLDLDQSELLPAPPETYSESKYTVVVRLPQADTFFGSRLLRAQRQPAGTEGGQP